MEGVMIKPQVKVEKLEFSDPTFEAGSVHTARSTITNPTAKEFTYDLELYLDVTKVASASGSVTIPAGSSRSVDFTITMPLTEGVYQPYVDAWVGADLIAHYTATELVTIAVTPAITIGPITWV